MCTACPTPKSYYTVENKLSTCAIELTMPQARYAGDMSSPVTSHWSDLRAAASALLRTLLSQKPIQPLRKILTNHNKHSLEVTWHTCYGSVTWLYTCCQTVTQQTHIYTPHNTANCFRMSPQQASHTASTMDNTIPLATLWALALQVLQSNVNLLL
jgi:hypothetical protein